MAKTDLQKYKKFLDEMGIAYEVEKNKNGTSTLTIDRMHIYRSYGNTIKINFDEEKNFIEFEAWGE
jgi:hypothetical protein